jgi:hypothetical protein
MCFDEADGMPVMQSPTIDQTSGRGLVLVEALSENFSTWGLDDMGKVKSTPPQTRSSRRSVFLGRRRWSKIERHISATTTRHGRLPGATDLSRCLVASACAAEPRRILSSITSIPRPRNSPYRVCRERGTLWSRRRQSASCSVSPVMWPRAPKTGPSLPTAPITSTSTGIAGAIRAKQ